MEKSEWSLPWLQMIPDIRDLAVGMAAIQCFALDSLAAYGFFLLGAFRSKKVSMLQARDENNNRRLSGGDEIRVVLCDKNGSMAFGTVEDKEDGTYEASYMVTLAGSHSISIFTGRLFSIEIRVCS